VPTRRRAVYRAPDAECLSVWGGPISSPVAGCRQTRQPNSSVNSAPVVFAWSSSGLSRASASRTGDQGAVRHLVSQRPHYLARTMSGPVCLNSDGDDCWLVARRDYWRAIDAAASADATHHSITERLQSAALRCIPATSERAPRSISGKSRVRPRCTAQSERSTA